DRSDGEPLSALLGAKELVFHVDGLLDTQNAQVTQGGLALEGFDPDTLSARDGRPILACGEALDVDGPCGGFNLSWAWLSGLATGRSAAKIAADER
ncbi:MAG: NAD(P)/FAD-dependent oxidoreductase, partial [Atopobiaceae bacterium]|nr:NAD(P)/FAD-dependent oxidoreductase [Atopobiaceae bacterium]